jgi:hypothetical protein
MSGLPGLDDKTVGDIDMDRVTADPVYRRRVISRLRRGWREAESRRQGSLFFDPAPVEEE